MPKIETPQVASVEEFSHAVISIVRNITLRNGEEWTPFDQITQMLTARDAAIRAESAELLRVCGEALKAAQSIKSLVQSIERGEDWEGGEPSLGTCRSLGRIKSISDEATTALAALKGAGVME